MASPVMFLRRRQLAAARGIPESELAANILVNTEAQSTSFKIDRQADLEEMADWSSITVGIPKASGLNAVFSPRKTALVNFESGAMTAVLL